MTRLLHTADTHVGYRQYHSAERRRDFVEGFVRLVEDAVAARVDAVVHAGDLFHDRRPDLRDLLGVLAVLQRLDDAGIPFLAVVGNHEATRRGQWLDLYERLGLATRLGDEPVVVDDVAVYGLDHVPPSRRDALDYDFEPHDADHAALVAHGLFTPFAHADWETVDVLEASNVAFDALLLGDNHAPGTERVDGTPVTYPGSTERTSAAERDPRGYNLVAFDGDVSVRRRTLETRPFVFVDVELGEGEGVERVREQVGQHDLEDAVVVVTVAGEGEPVTPARVEEVALEDGALVARVTDRREVEEEAGAADVSFADPDDAVRERVTEMGLSPVARDVDGTVRASKIARSNVRERVKERVGERLDDDVDAFEPGDDTRIDGASDGERAAADATGDEGTEPAEDDDGDPIEDADDESVGNDADPDRDADAESVEADAAAERKAEDEDGGDGEAATAVGDDGTAADRGSAAAGDEPTDGGDTSDGQVSMEDFL